MDYADILKKTPNAQNLFTNPSFRRSGSDFRNLIISRNERKGKIRIKDKAKDIRYRA